MDRNAVIIVTGAAGFIGSCMTGYLNRKGFQNIVIVDNFRDDERKHNFDEKKICARVEREQLFDWLNHYRMRIDFVFHLGAETDGGHADYQKWNLDYSKYIWQYCSDKDIPLVYASSAATYGDGEAGYKDDHSLVVRLKPLNACAISKNEFDKWVLQQSSRPVFWAGLKFFNVYGPNEYHKHRMSSDVYHLFSQFQASGKMRLYKSGRSEYNDGGQLCDFVYVKDVVDICYWLMQEQPDSGLYNVGTGKARTYNDLAAAIFKSLNKEPVVEFIDMPEQEKMGFNYFNEADINKLRNAGYQKEFYSLEDGVNTYLQHFLLDKKYY